MNKDASPAFLHDSNARHDPKLIELRAQWGIEGYGLYFMLIEFLREQAEYELPYKPAVIAIELGIDVAKVEAFICHCVELNLLSIFEDKLFSESLKKRMAKYDGVKKSRSKAGKKGAVSRWNTSNIQKENCESDTIANAIAEPLQTDSKRIAKVCEANSKPNIIQYNTIQSNTNKKGGVQRGKVDLDVPLEEFPTELQTPEAKQALTEWLDHKATQKTQYASKQSVLKLLKVHAPLGSKRFVEVVDWAISKEWDGLHPELTPSDVKQSPTTTTASPLITGKRSYQEQLDEIKAHNEQVFAKYRKPQEATA